MGILEWIGEKMSNETAGGYTAALDDLEEYPDIDALHQAADFYVKPISFENESSIERIRMELSAKNIVLLNMNSLSKNPAKQKMFIDNLRAHAFVLGGDIGMIKDNLFLITPNRVKIAKRKKRF